MKPDILVDTSAWIDYFNKPNSKIGKAVENIGRLAVLWMLDFAVISI